MLVMAGFGDAAHAGDATCLAARQRLDALLDDLAKGCSSDAQCEAAWVRPHTCDGPAVLRVGEAERADKKITGLQREVREACKDQYKDMPACAARASAPACRKGSCVDALKQ